MNKKVFVLFICLLVCFNKLFAMKKDFFEFSIIGKGNEEGCIEVVKKFNNVTSWLLFFEDDKSFVGGNYSNKSFKKRWPLSKQQYKRLKKIIVAYRKINN